jgi:PAS domain S-box-containing protein
VTTLVTTTPSRETGRAPAGVPSPAGSAAVAAGSFFVVAILWIVLSDRVLLALAPTPEAFAALQTWKGSLFVLVITLLLFVLLLSQFTRRSRQAASLAASGKRLRMQIENSPLAFVEFDADMRISGWSPRAEELFGWTSEEVLGDRWHDFGLVHPDDRALVEEAVEKAREKERTGWILANRNLRSDGSTLHCEWYNSWIRNENGEVTEMISLVHDVSWQQKALAEVRKLNRDLEARVHRRTEELAQANADLKGFTYSISHDLRAPVRAITGFGQILERRYGGDLPEEAQRYLGHMLEASGQMDRLIDGLLEYGRLEEGSLRLGAVDVTEIARRLETRFAPVLSEVGGSIQIDAPLPPALADVHLLERILQNLMDNALKFRHLDRAPCIRITGEREPGTSIIRVEDNGVGIPPGDRERVFGLFERIAESRGVEGAGMGLAIVRRATERIGGQIAIEDPRHGTSGAALVLRLPEASA